MARATVATETDKGPVNEIKCGWVPIFLLNDVVTELTILIAVTEVDA